LNETRSFEIIPSDWANWINVTLNYDPSFESLDRTDFRAERILGYPRPVFVILAASVVLTMLVSLLCIYNFVIGKRRWRKGFRILSRNPRGSFDDYEYAKFAEKQLIEDYDDDSSEDELYNASNHSLEKRHPRM